MYGRDTLVPQLGEESAWSSFLSTVTGTATKAAEVYGKVKALTTQAKPAKVKAAPKVKVVGTKVPAAPAARPSTGAIAGIGIGTLALVGGGILLLVLLTRKSGS